MNASQLPSIAIASCLAVGIARAGDLDVPSLQYPTIQDALDAAAAGDRIVLAAGTFTGPRNCDLDPLGKGVHILGAGPGATLLVVPAIPNSVEAGGFWISAGGSELVIEGLTITGAWRTDGAALHISGAAAPRIVDCVLTANSAFSRGGGVFVTDSASPSFEGCRFENVFATLGGAAWIGATAHPSFASCTFASNGANYDGGAVFLESGAANFDACNFSSNQAVSTGGAVALSAGALATFSSTTFDLNWTTSLPGGAIHAQGAGTRLVLATCTLTGNNSASSGGAIALSDAAELVATDCVLDANLAYSGGALDAAGFTTSTLTRCVLSNHTVAGDGGGVSIRDHSTSTFDQCTLLGNRASLSGGGLALSYGSTALLLDPTVSANATDGPGGGVYVTDGSSLEVRSSGSFAGNSATSGGGVSISVDSSASVYGVAFDSNDAVVAGGGVQVDGSSSSALSMQLEGCTFGNNRAALGGAAYANDAASVTALVCNFVGNTASGDGGALLATGTGLVLTVTNCTASANVAAGHGGSALISSGASARFEDVEFADNGAGFDGGAIRLSSPETTAQFLHCTVTGNHAVGGGGAFSIDGAHPVLIDESLMRQNTAADAGAIELSNGANLTLLRSRLESNHTTATGGACVVASGAFLTSERTYFVFNDAQLGAGGLEFASGDGALRWCYVDDNTTPGGGGGLRASGSAFVRVHGCQLSGNAAAVGGAIQALDAARVVLGNATLFENAAASGGGIEFDSPNVILANSIVWANVPDSLHSPGGSGAIVNFCDIAGGWAGSGNFDADPLLELFGGDLHRPQSGSPCIDAGDNARVPALLTTDMLDRPRFLDDPWTPNAGAGTAPIVDLGAVEFLHEPVVYCQGRVNSQGCVPSIAYSGVANGWPRSCTEASFWIYGSNVINNKEGILFFGLSGRNAAPWLGGTLCVRQPIRRTPTVDSSGNPPPDDCSGGFAYEFSGWLCNDPTLAPGTRIDAQWWGRDPSQSGPNKTQLSNAIEFVLN